MTHKAKVDVWLLAVILFGVAALAAGANRWVAGSVVADLLICAAPQMYVTTDDKLVVVHAAVLRTKIPYGAITYVGPDECGTDGVCIQYGLGSQMRIVPADPDAFLADMAKRAPHLGWRNGKLVAALG
ncbi:MAG TPA: PH domain-containing protein [Bryobacteraceae bacterium]